MEEQVQHLVEKTWAKYLKLEPSKRLLIAISGIPGSGKTTLARTVTAQLNELFKTTSSSISTPTSTNIASYIPMDGYHLSRAELSALPNPIEAHSRRGAAFTFNSASFLTLVQKIRNPLTPSTSMIYAPSFSHALKDPVENDIPIPSSARIIIFEGLYLSLGKSPWREAAELMDELWFVDVDFGVAARRLVPRHVKAGIADDEEQAWSRVRENDLVNGEEIVSDRVEVHEVVVSREDASWAP